MTISIDCAIKLCLSENPLLQSEEIAQAIGHPPRDVQDALTVLDDLGHVLMRNGRYRLSEAYKAGLVK